MLCGLPVSAQYFIQRSFKVQQESKMAVHVGSQLFSPFRALGFVTNHVPLALQPQGTDNLVATAVGSSFHVYNVSFELILDEFRFTRGSNVCEILML